jgi:hypothetical protein
VFESITLQPPLFVIEVLPPTRVVGAHCLQVSVGYWADPHLLPGGWDDEELAALDLLGVQAIPGLVQIDESFPGAPPGPSWISR